MDGQTGDLLYQYLPHNAARSKNGEIEHKPYMGPQNPVSVNHDPGIETGVKVRGNAGALRSPTSYFQSV